MTHKLSKKQLRAMFAKQNQNRHDSWEELQKKGINLSRFGDTDKDGTYNQDDAEPLNSSIPKLPFKEKKFLLRKGDIIPYYTGKMSSKGNPLIHFYIGKSEKNKIVKGIEKLVPDSVAADGTKYSKKVFDKYKTNPYNYVEYPE